MGKTGVGETIKINDQYGIEHTDVVFSLTTRKVLQWAKYRVGVVVLDDG